MSSHTVSSLQQRLAALSNASTSSSTPHHDQSSSIQSPMTPRKSFFNTPWSRRKPASDDDGLEMVQEVMTKLIFQAGVDFETRPMVVLNASALPDPRQVNYDILLSRVLSYLDLYVESDYTVIFFAAGGNHTPGWNWVWKAYRSLSRKYRKNLKRLYVVHSTFYSKMLFSLAGAIISPKFFRKITYVSSLSSLAYHIPLTQIDIPPAVYSENLKYESSITLPTPIPSSIFGVPLEDIMGYQGEKGGVPRIVKDVVAYIRETGLDQEGIFRRSPSSAMLTAAREAYDRGNVVSLDTFGDPHLAAVLLKKYLRDLPQPIFPEALYPLIRRCPLPSSSTDMAAVTYIRDVLLPELPPCVYILLSCVLQLLHEVSLHSGKNRMDAYNLAVVISPNLVKGSNPARDVMMCMAQGSPALFGGSSSPTAGDSSNAVLHTPRPQAPMTALLTPLSSSSSNANTVDPRTPVVSLTTSTPNTSPPPAANNTTLGTIIKLCIQQFYEVFDEVRDPTEAITLLPAHPEEAEFVGDPAGKSTVGRGFGFGMDMELSGSEDESEGNNEGRDNLTGFRFGNGAGTARARNWSMNSVGWANGSGVGGAVSTVELAIRKLSGGNLQLPGAANREDDFDTDEVLFTKIEHHRRQSSGRQHHRKQSSGRYSMRSTGTSGTTDDEEIDDAMLVMPLGPPSPKNLSFLQAQQANGSHLPSASMPTSPATPNYPTSPTMPMSAGMVPPSSWGNHKYNYTTLGSNYAPYKPRSRIRAVNTHSHFHFTPITSAPTSTAYTQSNPTSTHSSIHSGNGSGSGFPFSGKAKSVISIEKAGGGFSGAVGKGSISVGTRGTMGGTTGKSIGATVEAIGITAEGFFTPPPGVGVPLQSVSVGREEGRGGDEVATPTVEVPHSQDVSTDPSGARDA